MKAKLLRPWVYGIAVLSGAVLWGQTPVGTSSAGSSSILLTVENKVDVARAGRPADWTPGRTNLTLNIADRVRTGLKSRAAIRLHDLSVIRVDEATTLAIEAPPSGSNKPTLELRSGSTYFFSRERPAELQFKTPLVSGAIRGTEFNLTVAENGQTIVTLIDGAVDLANEFGATNIVSGEQGIIDPGQPPRKTPMIDAINIIQWSLYYPGILNPDELDLSNAERNALSASLAAYRSGDLLGALSAYPDNRQASSNAERLYSTALLLVVGQVDQAEPGLQALSASSPVSDALRQLIAAVKHQPWTRTRPPQLATEWMAESYYQQSRSELEQALEAARAATRRSPDFGFAWVRLAELEFSFGRVPQALAALDKGLQHSPRNAQGLALKGFLLAAQNKIDDALGYFDQAIAIDGALGNAWLGRGLCKIRQGHGADGRADLQTAATLEPNRSVLRSYLGKAFSYTRDEARAEKELDLAKRFDPNDPTGWLYSALLNQQRNRVNQAIHDLEQSQELNKNRSVFRSQLLLDQDRAVRSANLAAIYRDAAMTDLSVREASRAVNYDYANYSAHLFLANSYDAIRDPKLINLRYETPWFTEYLVANLLAPVGAGTLSQNISQQEYSKLFESDGFGVSSSTEYFSNGDWVQRGSQFGTFGNTSYAFDAYYRSDHGQRPNNDLRRLFLTGQFKQQLTPADSLLVMAQYVDLDSGDVAQYYDQDRASLTTRIKENQEPNVFIGWHHQWAPGAHSLLLAGRLDDTLLRRDSDFPAAVINRGATGDPESITLHRRGVGGSAPNALDYRSELEAYTVDFQQIWQQPKHTLVAGARYQTGWLDTFSSVQRPANTFPFHLSGLDSTQDVETDLERISVYGYHYWQALDSLQFTFGLSYDRLEYPSNTEDPPLVGRQSDNDQVSPKVGFIWNPWRETYLRGLYTRSLGGIFFDNSVRLEPTQIAGFNQAFRSILPESIRASVAGSEFETWGLALDHRFPTDTYVSVVGEILKSDAERHIGMFDRTIGDFGPAATSQVREQLDFEERSLTFTVNQLIGRYVALGASYRITEADFDHSFRGITPTIPGAPSDEEATLHQVNLSALFTHDSGVFGQFTSVWSQQSNRGYTPDLPGDDFWQFNVFVGYRFLRRAAEVKVGLLNFTDQDYQLNPLTLYSELPRERMIYGSFKFYF